MKKIIFSLVLIFLNACVSKKLYTDLQGKYDALRDEKKEILDRKDALLKTLAKSKQENETLKKSYENLKNSYHLLNSKSIIALAKNVELIAQFYKKRTEYLKQGLTKEEQQIVHKQKIKEEYNPIQDGNSGNSSVTYNIKGSAINSIMAKAIAGIKSFDNDGIPTLNTGKHTFNVLPSYISATEKGIRNRGDELPKDTEARKTLISNAIKKAKQRIILTDPETETEKNDKDYFFRSFNLFQLGKHNIADGVKSVSFKYKKEKVELYNGKEADVYFVGFSSRFDKLDQEGFIDYISNENKGKRILFFYNNKIYYNRKNDMDIKDIGKYKETLLRKLEKEATEEAKADKKRWNKNK